MKQVIDLSRSKRPINIPDEEDVKMLESARTQAVDELKSIELAIERLESPEYTALAKESKKDMIEIALAAMDLEADDVKGFSRAQGQFFERKRLTLKLANVRIEAEEKKGLIVNLKNQVGDLIKRLRKTKEGKKDGR